MLTERNWPVEIIGRSHTDAQWAHCAVNPKVRCICVCRARRHNLPPLDWRNVKFVCACVNVRHVPCACVMGAVASAVRIQNERRRSPSFLVLCVLPPSCSHLPTHKHNHHTCALALCVWKRDARAVQMKLAAVCDSDGTTAGGTRTTSGTTAAAARTMVRQTELRWPVGSRTRMDFQSTHTHTHI